jgi:hypothetical protein
MVDESALTAAADWGAGCVWLSDNQETQRTQQFYKKCDFTVNGTRTFQLGAHGENDYVMVRQFDTARALTAAVSATSRSATFWSSIT